MSNKIFLSLKKRMKINNLSYFAIIFVLFRFLYTVISSAVYILVSSDNKLSFELLFRTNFLLGGLYFLLFFLNILIPIFGVIFSLLVYKFSKEKFKYLESMYLIIFSAIFIVDILYTLNYSLQN